MTVNFSNPVGAVNVSFSSSLKALSDSGLLDPQPGGITVQFSSPAGAPIKAYPGQLRTHG